MAKRTTEGNKEATSRRAAMAASEVIRRKSTSKSAKTAAGLALTQGDRVDPKVWPKIMSALDAFPEINESDFSDDVEPLI